MSDSRVPEAATGEGGHGQARKSGRFASWFWRLFLVGSVAFAWYSFYVPSNSIAWAQDFTVAQEQAGDTGKPILLFFTAEW
ncbi:MAG: hypothetical protein ACYSU1_05760 [Planctomycetota bacterium]